RAPSGRIASGQPRAGMTPSRSDRTLRAKTSSASRSLRQDCKPLSDPLAERQCDNVCFDFFACCYAVQAPGTLLQVTRLPLCPSNPAAGRWNLAAIFSLSNELQPDNPQQVL